ncbi:MAG: glyoxylate/hydroxypyruvate reductase A [Paracoccaceae bacterium]
MALNVQFCAATSSWETYQGALMAAFQKLNLGVNLRRDHGPDLVDHIVYAPSAGPQLDFGQFTNLRAVHSLWAGVETITHNKTLKVPLARMVDSGLRDGMVEWVLGHVLRYHLGMDAHICAQNSDWTPVSPPLARNRHVGILGLGALGSACAQALLNLNFQVSGWSRNQKSLDGVDCMSGADGLENILRQSEILVLLLPLTDATENTLNADAIAKLPAGARILNPGRGALIDDNALLHALETGHIGHATLDVFRTEPLPKDHGFWHHPNITVTPHVASQTRPDTASELIAMNIQRFETGQTMRFLVNRGTGY